VHCATASSGSGQGSVEAERRLAEESATEDALSALPRLADELSVDPEVTDRTWQEYEAHLRVVRADRQASADAPLLLRAEQYNALRLALLDLKRATVLALRDSRQIDDILLRQVQSELDLEEVRVTSRRASE
jgi:hypothetical protein